ncbi:hypothetical protein KAR91_54645 [Candidatus Pacearchaeota archaeon]|nr:hypothetical protein [Candidatus Pacearchaeota archaeon]
MRFIIVVLISLFTPVIASAQAICGERTSLLKQLEGNYKESPISMGLASNGSVVELTRSDIGTWTILLTTPKGITCLIAAGKNWEDIESKPIGEEL